MSRAGRGPLLDWTAGVKEVVERRNRVVHAIALNQCMNAARRPCSDTHGPAKM